MCRGDAHADPAASALLHVCMRGNVHLRPREINRVVGRRRLFVYRLGVRPPRACLPHADHAHVHHRQRARHAEPRIRSRTTRAGRERHRLHAMHHLRLTVVFVIPTADRVRAFAGAELWVVSLRRLWGLRERVRGPCVVVHVRARALMAIVLVILATA